MTAPDQPDRLADLERRLQEAEQAIAILVQGHRTHASHLGLLDAARDQVERSARAAVERAREAAREQRLQRAASPRVRVRAVEPVDLHVGRVRVHMDPQNRRGDSARIWDAAIWARLVEDSPDLADLVGRGALTVEDLTPDEARS